MQLARTHFTRQALPLLLVACVAARALLAQSSPATSASSTARPSTDVSAQRALIEQSIAARKAGDYAGARSLAREAVTQLLAWPAAEQDQAWLAVLDFGGSAASAAEDMSTANAARKRVYEVRLATLADDDPALQRARQNLATTLFRLGDLTSARSLFEKALEVNARTLPQDHAAVQQARQNLASTIATLGDVAGARALFEMVLDVRSRTLPDEHPDLQTARQNLAATIATLGDPTGARPLFEKVLEVNSRTLPDDHPALQRARQNLAVTLFKLGDFAGARALFETVVEVDSRTLPEDHPDLQEARLSLAAAMSELGEFAEARGLTERVAEVESRTLPDDHPALQTARQDLAAMIAKEIARDILASGKDADRKSAREAARARCAEVIRDLCRAHLHASREAILESPGREAEERCSTLTLEIDTCLSFAQGYCVLEPMHELESPAFVSAETTRGAAIVSADLTRRAASSPKYGALRNSLQEASDELAALAQQGATSEQFDRAREKRESVEREPVVSARELSGARESGVEFNVASLSARLEEGEAAVGFRRFKKWCVEIRDELDSTGQQSVGVCSVLSLCAFVVRSSKNGVSEGSALTLVDLGPLGPVESAVHAWRESIRVSLARGTAVAKSEIESEERRGDVLRRLVFDPLIPALGAANQLVVVLDDALHLVPLDALPLAANEPEGATSARLVGDRWRIETRSTLTELLMDPPLPTGSALLALGGASFNLPPLALAADEVGSLEPTAQEEQIESKDDGPSNQVAGILRGSAWERGFVPLTHTGDEARGIGALYTEIYEGQRPALVLEKRKASREALEEFAPQARFVHIATHGWFAPESIKSWGDRGPLDKQSGLGTRLSSEEQVRGMSPMLLCGLALAGANLSETATGRAPGLVTADELSTLDLSNCELAVLSACDTNVGERRAGQGVASLQKALQMAGARSVITSLWKVPDEATKELMLDFYRRLWVEKKPKHQALWEAKTKLREAKDERGEPKYTTRDWAAWVLTGDPR